MPDFKDTLLRLAVAASGKGAMEGWLAGKQMKRQREDQEREGLIGMTRLLMQSDALDDEGHHALLGIIGNAYDGEKGLKKARTGLVELMTKGVRAPHLAVTGEEPGGPIRVDANTSGFQGLIASAMGDPQPPAPASASSGLETYAPTTRGAGASSAARWLPMPESPTFSLPAMPPDLSVPVQTEYEGAGPAPKVEARTHKRLLLPRAELRQRELAEKTEEIKALDEARWPGREREMRREYELRGELQKPKVDAAALRSERLAVMANLRMFKGQQLDPSNPVHAALLSRAANAGIVIDPEAWNNSKDNLVLMSLTDPDDPTKTNFVSFNKATGDQQVIGQKGFQAPVNSDTGMTPFQEVQAEQARSRIVESQARVAKILQDMNAGIPAGVKRQYDVETGDLKARLRAINLDRSAIQRRLAEGKALPSDFKERLDALDAEEKGIAGQIEEARQRALSARGGRSGVLPAVPGTASKGRVSRKNFGTVRAQNPGLQGKSDAEVERALKAAGVEVIN